MLAANKKRRNGVIRFENVLLSKCMLYMGTMQIFHVKFSCYFLFYNCMNDWRAELVRN